MPDEAGLNVRPCAKESGTANDAEQLTEIRVVVTELR